MYIYIYISLRVYLHYIYLYLSIYIYICVYIYIYLSIYICVYLYISIYVSRYEKQRESGNAVETHDLGNFNPNTSTSSTMNLVVVKKPMEPITIPSLGGLSYT